MTPTRERPRLAFWQIWNMSFGFLGIQFGWGLQMANMSPIYKYLGAEESQLPYLWLAGPLTGLLIQPIVGAMSDRTWTRLGRRRPYFLVGAIIASLALVAMPHSSELWMAASLLWILDASINITMEPFRAFVGDKLPPKQRTSGFLMQSFFIGLGQTLANALPFVLATWLGVKGALASGIPMTTYYAFLFGAGAFLLAVLWTVISTREDPPEDLETFRREHAGGGVLGAFAGIVPAIRAMPRTMKQLAVVQFFTWFALPCMWQFFGIAVARDVFHATDVANPFQCTLAMTACLGHSDYWAAFGAAFAGETASFVKNAAVFEEGTNWAGLCFAAYNVVCFAVAFLLAPIANRFGARLTHAICLIIGGGGLLATGWCATPHSLWLPMAAVGIAWASILSLPYVMLAGSVPASRMGVYMGVFNLFIVLPQVAMSFLTPLIYKPLLGGDPMHVVMLGGASLIVAAVTLKFVDEGAAG